jgi:uncharacterized protein (TIGR03663 family)
MRTPRSLWPWAVAILVLAALLRLYALEAKAPHHDEAVNGFFAERIVENGYYQYNPKNFHGPLYFYALAMTRDVLGHGLWQLRLFGALCGVALCLVPLLAASRLGRPTAVLAGVFLAVSPTLVYVSRSAIHEPLLVLGTLVAMVSLCRWADGGRPRWLYAAVLAVAAMIATKETAVLFLALLGLVVAIESGVHRGEVFGRRLAVLRQPRHLLTALLFAGSALAIHVLAYTAAFRDPRGPSKALAASVETYGAWFRTGTKTGHAKPWSWFLDLTWRYEAMLLVLAVIGLAAAWRVRAARWAGLLGFGLLALHSAIAYKTPWLAANWVALLAIPAAAGVVAAMRWLAARPPVRAIAAVAVAAGLAVSGWRAHQLAVVDPADPSESLVYVQTGPDYWALVDPIERARRRLGADQLRIRVIARDDLWPLPWTFLPYPHRSAGGLRDGRIDDDFVAVEERQRERLERALDGEYIHREFVLRPGTRPLHAYYRVETFASELSER